MDEEATNVAGIAKLLDVSRETVSRKAVNVAERDPERGEIPGFRIGSRWKFFPSIVRGHLTKPVDPWEYLPAAKARMRNTR